ncbi:hypothetical protein DL546_001671 [Coniochaeta pulveracea]|uniref:MYND-type zinc finger protein samB n=1 Tax=Coniochaeta pulveracea TaxID=177199 RepID=A0A420YDF7_9PEZI|nr:hypothetical protein DL546_001671 [Coniochaeta pulveracea]
MREVNFSIPNVNKASVGITTALYDRRALDCTATLPLINSLNHLAYLTTSSARIRDILTVDGGIERLVCILKQGRSKDMMDMWRWSLAFQCVVNIGVRGTEAVRTRVVEADMVPVIATILDNYIKVTEKCRDKAEEARQKQLHEPHHRHRSEDHSRSSTGRPSSSSFETRSRRLDVEQRAFRRQPPPAAIDVSATYSGQHGTIVQSNSDVTPTAASIGPFAPMSVTSMPTSPTTPLPPPQIRSPTVRPTLMMAPGPRELRRPEIRHQHSTSAELEDMNVESSVQSDEAPDTDMSGANDVAPAVGIQDITMEDDDTIIAGAGIDMTTPTVSETQETGTFNITHRGTVDGSIINTTAPTPVPVGLSPNRPTMVAPQQPQLPTTSVPRYLLDRQVTPNTQMIAAMPREEDVLMSLQLLAYVSKYCNLRKYFQKSHLVPRLKIGKEMQLLDGIDPAALETEMEQEEEEYEEEFLLPNDLNIFPLVEKFTVRYHSTDMQYWAGVVMRNLCRKDDTRGGIRQCAYYQCGKWEEYTRQFAKCRRCRRTKYCSKECQKSAWAFHRHWCIAASS